MRFDFIRGAPHDVHAAAIRFPSRNPRSVMLIRVRYAAIMLFLEIIVREIGIAAAAKPKLFDELFALFVGIKLQKSLPLFGRNDVDDILVEPLLVRSVQFLEGLLELSPLVLV